MKRGDLICGRRVVVFAGSFWAGSTESGLSAGLRDLGCAVQEIDQRSFGVQPGRDVLLRVAARLLRQRAEDAYRKAVLDACRVLKPDLFLTVKGVGITADLLRQVKESGTRTVMYYPDFHFDHPSVSVDSFLEYDLFVTTKSFQIRHLEEHLDASRVAYVPHGYVSSVHRPLLDRVTEDDYGVDVLHAGNHSAYKQKWIEGAAAALKEATFRIVGNRWRENTGDGPLARSDMPGERIGVAYAEAIQTSRINIAVHMGPTASGWQDLVSTRTFEIPACRGFMLHIDNDEVRSFFEPGVEIDIFSTPEELVDKIRFYLARPELRARMIERAYARAVPAYSYGSCAEAIGQLVKERLSALREV